MRVENVKVTFDIPVHFGQPDKNRYVYTKESWEEAVKKRLIYLHQLKLLMMMVHGQH